MAGWFRGGIAIRSGQSPCGGSGGSIAPPSKRMRGRRGSNSAPSSSPMEATLPCVYSATSLTVSMRRPRQARRPAERPARRRGRRGQAQRRDRHRRARRRRLPRLDRQAEPGLPLLLVSCRCVDREQVSGKCSSAVVFLCLLLSWTCFFGVLLHDQGLGVGRFFSSSIDAPL